MTVSKSNFTKNFSSDMDFDDDCCTAATHLATTQNDWNAKRLNNGEVVNKEEIEYRTDSGKPGFSCSRRVGIVVISFTAFILIAGVVAICASFVLIGMMGFQQIQMASLKSENDALKIQNAAFRNDTLSHSERATTCEKELTNVEHSMQINSLQCEQAKENISNLLKAEIRDREVEKELGRQELENCQRQKSEVTQSYENHKRNAEEEKKAIGDELKQCKQEKDQLSQRLTDNIKEAGDYLKSIRCPSSEPVYHGSQSHSGSASPRSLFQASTATFLFVTFLLYLLR